MNTVMRSEIKTIKLSDISCFLHDSVKLRKNLAIYIGCCEHNVMYIYMYMLTYTIEFDLP